MLMIVKEQNKSMGDFGIETRVPFLDNKVVDFAMNQLPVVDKMSGTHPSGPKAEKWFCVKCSEILYQILADRTKAQFSDAAGSNWIDACKSYAESKISDEKFSKAAEYFLIRRQTQRRLFSTEVFSQRYFRKSMRLTKLSCSNLQLHVLLT